MIVQILIIVISLLAVSLTAIISYALMQDVVDPITKRSMQDNGARTAGIIGYIICCAISFGLWHYLFK